MQDPLICYYNDPPATTYSFGRDDDPMWIESQPALRSCYSPDGGEEAPLPCLQASLKSVGWQWCAGPEDAVGHALME
jgi:hypothetical protein